MIKYRKMVPVLVAGWVASSSASQAALVAADFVGHANSETNYWYDFALSPAATPEGYAHVPDQIASQLGAGHPDVHQAGSPTLSTVSNDNSLFYTSTGNIYTFSGVKDYEVVDLPDLLGGTSSLGLSRVSLAVSTLGAELDYASMRLVYQNTGGSTVSLGATLEEELARQVFEGDFGGTEVAYRWTWDLDPGEDISSYKLVWSDASSSVSLQEVRLDTLSASRVPEPSSVVLVVGAALVAAVRRQRGAEAG